MIEKEILRELLRQVHHSYNLAISVTAGSALITLLGIGLLYLGKIPAASITTAGGAIASLGSIQFAKESKEELHEMLERCL
ncbi:TRADD-N-associated membrane domain-containing protein [Phormidesmis sp. 146-33]